MTKWRRFFYSSAYFALAVSGLIALFTPSMVRDQTSPELFFVWQVFIIIGGLVGGASFYAPKSWQVEKVGIPPLFVGMVAYMATFFYYALETGRGWGVAFILVGVVLNLVQRWLNTLQGENHAL